MEPLEIHVLKNGRCRVFQGEARRVFYSTEEAVALALLKVNPAQEDVGSMTWMDFLTTHGIAIGRRGTTIITMMVRPAKMRTVPWRATRHGEEPLQSLVATFPPLLILTRMVDAKLVKSFMYMIQPGKEQSLTTRGSDRCLVPFPYGNVYDYGKICWGTVATTEIAHPCEVEDLFFKSGFNGDLWTADVLDIEDASLADLVERTGGDLPSPPVSAYGTSVRDAMEMLT